MRPSLFQAPLPQEVRRCDVCQWRCELAPGETGRCGVRLHHAGSIQSEADGVVSAATIGPIEDQRLWHFFPDAQVFNVGSYGTPILTEQAAQYGQLPEPAARRQLPAERVADFAQQRLCRGVVWAYNDPAVTLEWTLDGLKLARAGSRFTAVVSSGYFSSEAIEAIGPYLDGIRLDLLGFSDQAYVELGGIQEWQGIMAGAEWLRERWNTHIEVSLRLHAGVNDRETEIETLARWMREKLGALTPLHLLSRDGQPTWEHLADVARAAGLEFVYGPDPDQPTRCPQCRWVVIERSAGPTQLTGVSGEVCESCGTSLGLRTSLFRRQTRYQRGG